jgi:hypothetical protein
LFRFCIFACAVLGVFVTDVSAIIQLYLDEFDDVRIIHAVAEAERVKESRKDLKELGSHLLKLDRVVLAAILAKPAEKPAKTYAIPLGEMRSIALSGLRDANDKRPDKDFVTFHPVGDFAAVEFYYSRHKSAVDTPLAVRFYLKADRAFPKLTKDNLDQRLAWDRGQLRKLVEHIGKKAEGLPSGASGSQLKKLIDHIGKSKPACFGDLGINAIAVGDWSTPVDNLRGRLLIAQGRILGAGKTRETVMYVELQNVSAAVGDDPLHVYFENKLRCELHDGSGKLVPPKGYGANGGRPGPSWITLPCDSSMRLRFGLYGHGRAKDAGLLIPLPDDSWFLPAEATDDFYLSGTFTVSPPKDHGRDRAWKGTLALPKAKISVQER